MITRRFSFPVASVLLFSALACNDSATNPGSTPPAAVAGIVATSASTRLYIGDTARFTAVVSAADGSVITGKPLTWRSSDDSIVSIAPDGLATALSVGSADITCMAEGIESPVVRIEVLPSTRSGSLIPGPVSNDRATGTVTLQRKRDGSLQLLFGEDFESRTGPRLIVVLSKTESPKGGLNLGALRQQSGSHAYDVPSDVTLDTYNYAFVYCIAFDVVFGGTMLR